MDQADIKLLPPRDGEQKKNPILGSLMEKGMQVGPPPAQPVVAWGRLLPHRRANLHPQARAEHAPALLPGPKKSHLPTTRVFVPHPLCFKQLGGFGLQ